MNKIDERRGAKVIEILDIYLRANKQATYYEH